MDSTMGTSTPEQPAAALGAAVRLQRQRLGLRQKALADLAGVGVAFLYDLERGKPTLRLDKVLAVLRVLGLGLTVAPSDRAVRAELDREAPRREPLEP
jgi:y4mF family transcriptional regulator